MTSVRHDIKRCIPDIASRDVRLYDHDVVKSDLSKLLYSCKISQYSASVSLQIASSGFSVLVLGIIAFSRFQPGTVHFGTAMSKPLMSSLGLWFCNWTVLDSCFRMLLSSFGPQFQASTV